VFGRIIGHESIEINQELVSSQFEVRVNKMHAGDARTTELRGIRLEEVATHAIEDDCWTVIDGKVYDLSGYANEHPGGSAAVTAGCGKDSTKRFLVAHSIGILADMDFEPIGISVY